MPITVDGDISVSGVSLTFQQEGNWFLQVGKTLRTELLKFITKKECSVAKWFRALYLKSGVPWFKFSTLLLCKFVLDSLEFHSLTVLCCVCFQPPTSWDS